MKSHCPVNFALEHFGDKWSLLIIRDLMFKGKRHYNEFFESEEKISTSVLGDRLKTLEQTGIITKGEDAVKQSRIKYSLTAKGVDLLPVMVDIIEWSTMYDHITAADKNFALEAGKDRVAFVENMKKKLIDEHMTF